MLITEDQYGVTGGNPTDSTLLFTMATVEIRDTWHYNEIVDGMLLLEDLPGVERNIELTIFAQVVKEFDDQHTPEPALPYTRLLRDSERRGPRGGG